MRIKKTDLDHLQLHVRVNVQHIMAKNIDYHDLRALSSVPPYLVNKYGVSDNDLSLVVLGLNKTKNGLPVIILLNDQDFLTFISWIRTQKRQFQLPVDPSLLQSWRCLTYLEQIHRSCNISTELMREIIDFSLIDHYTREDLNRRGKGLSILGQLIQVDHSFGESIAIKHQTGVKTQ
jgi:hypothetical protein